MDIEATRTGRRERESGFTIIEVMVAAVVLLLVYFGAAQYAARSRSMMDLDESRRIASSIARSRLESLRREESFDSLPTLAGRDTTYVVDSRSYAVSHNVQAGVPETFASTVTVTVSWTKLVGGNSVPRTLTLASIFGRSIPWDDTGAGGGAGTGAGAGGGFGGFGGEDEGGLDEDDDEHGHGHGHGGGHR